MPDPFMSIRFHVADKTDEELHETIDARRTTRGAFRGVAAAQPTKKFDNDETAARFYLDRVLHTDQRPAMRGLSAPERPDLVPDMVVEGTHQPPTTKTKVVRFAQTQNSIPIFGTQVVVELDQKRQLIAVSGKVAKVEQYLPLASVSPQQALESIANTAEVPGESLQNSEQPTLTLYCDKEADRWHLAYFFKNVPAAPKAMIEELEEGETDGHGLGVSPRSTHPYVNYLVDAHDGEVLFYYSAAPTLTKCKGIGELDDSYDFYGEKIGDQVFEMSDYRRNLKTYDLGLKDISSDFPCCPISHNSTNFTDDSHRAAVSAHANAMKVHDFYKSVLMRDGIDDKGMDLVSVVNCCYTKHENPPEWHNAVWWNGRMWYGQTKDGNGKFHSYSRFLDVIAHELTHGITEHTSKLVYADESGALNESFSDIFGIIIRNWYNTKSPTDKANTDVSTWNWELGPGLGKNGLPLRDISDPTRTGHPDHYEKRLKTKKDSGGVHTNSNIHNKAAYNVLTAVDENGQYVFAAQDVVEMYYECLSRLNSLATFSEALQVLIDFAKTFYAGDPEEQRMAKIGHLKKAYEKVGIGLPKE